ncbi:MAG TPA: hypothetical protein PKI05_02755 [Thermogutta sp.]|nr:hypothetical protein [Thermogutta sp.]HPU05667.1 hypothetical protein [Thermogutta sp.]HPZ84007.1 hypothetical protein [Thermogutta sp.]HQF13783.1 hypothetical protein [Thermogutta sp.]
MRILKLLVIVALIGVAGIAWTPLAWASELDWGQVPDNWRWIVHFDIDQLRDSKVAATLFSEFWHAHPERHKIEAIAALAGLNLKKDLHGVTFLGTRFDPKFGAMIIHCRMNPDLLVGLIASEPTYRRRESKGLILHQWTDRNDNSEITGCFLDQDHLVLGKDATAVEVIIERYQQKSSQERPDFFNVRKGTYLQIHANELQELSVPFMSPLLRRSRRLSAMVGEQSGQFFLQCSFEVEGAEIALDLKDALTGLVAIGKLHYADRPEYVAGLTLIRVFASENKTTMVWTMPAEPALRVLKEIASQVATEGKKSGGLP